MGKKLTPADMLKLSRWNTPTIYNGWEAITRHDRRTCYNLEETRDFMPVLGPIVGRAITVQFEPGNPEHPKNDPNAWRDYREYVASVPGPKIVVVQDLEKPKCIAAFWGEVNSSVHLALGCVGTVIDGAIRDVDEMGKIGFKAIGRQLNISHGFSQPVNWNCDVEVFGCKVQPGQLIHADQHGFIVIPREDEERLLEMSMFLENLECETVIPAAQNTSGKSHRQILDDFHLAAEQFSKAVGERAGAKGEW